MNKQLIIFTDCGDTLVDESTEIRDETQTVIKSGLIPGAKEALLYLHEQGYRIALVADGTVKSFNNIIDEHGIRHAFETLTISEALGCAKPHPLMFYHTMKAMNLDENDIPRIVMIGNNLKRDVVGANQMGICSILISFSPRYCMTPTCDLQNPDYVVSMPDQLPALIEQLELQLENRKILKAPVLEYTTQK